MSENDQVKLKPVFGMHPGKYLTILYAVIILLAAFLILFLPGIVNPGTVYDIRTNISFAAVFVDGEYAGPAPGEVFIPAGDHRVEVVREYYHNFESDLTSRRRLFGSLFAPRREVLDVELASADYNGLLEAGFAEFANWGMIDTYYENYQPKPVLEPLFEDLYRTGYSDSVELSSFLYSAMPFVHDEVLYEDYTGALRWFEAIRTGEEPSKDAADFQDIRFFQDTAKFFENIPFWYYSLLSDEKRNEKVNWYPAMQEEYGLFLRDFSNDFPSATAAVTVYGNRFIMLSGGQFLMGTDGNSFPYPAAVNDFLIMDREVTNDLYSMFLSENPSWRADNINKLIDDGLVNRDYLKDFPDSDAGEPVNFISWYAANAFCSWLETKLPAYMADYSVRLPDEIEWEWAALTEINGGGIFKDSGSDGPVSAGGRMPNDSGIYDLKGNLWEWCGNWYAPASALITSRSPAYNESYIGAYPGIERSVRGGSWANEKSVTTSTRGSQPPSWCTDFLGFRPVLVKE